MDLDLNKKDSVHVKIEIKIFPYLLVQREDRYIITRIVIGLYIFIEDLCYTFYFCYLDIGSRVRGRERGQSMS